MRQLIVLCTFNLTLVLTGFSQAEYRAGTSRVSIEPWKSLISLHLGGYGAPREGRFTLHWTNRQHLPSLTALSAASGELFIINNGELMRRDPAKSDPNWQTEVNIFNMRSLTSCGSEMYAVNNQGKFYVADSSVKSGWTKTDLPDLKAVALASSGFRLFALDGTGSIWQADLSQKRKTWKVLESMNGIISIAANDRKLFALTDGGIIFQCDPADRELKWLRAAYRNNHTIKDDIRMITIAGNTIYGYSSSGYLYEGEHRSRGNLTAGAMAISHGNNTVVIVSADICGLNDTFTGLLKKEIYEKHRLPPSSVFINSSHTHFAPVSQDWLTWQEANQRPDSVYLHSILKKGILKAVDEALAAATPAQLFFGRGSTDIGYNRSLKDHPELYDNSVDVLKVKYSGTDSESYLFMAACHPVFSTAGVLHYTISANYPGVARKLVEERTGTVNSLFLQGTAGDINPRDNGEYISGEKLANEVINVLSRPMTELRGGISHFLDTINIPVDTWSENEILDFRAQNISKTEDIYAEKNVRWCDLMLSYLKQGTMPEALPVYVHTINIGDWKLVGFSRETTTAYGFGVKNLWPVKMVSVAGYTNDVSSYLPTSMHIEARNYEGLDSFFWYGMPAVFPVSVYDTIMDRIKYLNR